MTTKRDAIDAALSMAEDINAGKINPANLDAELVDRCHELFGSVAGPADALWPLHVDVARQVLGLGGVAADELSEWLAVARQRTGEPPQAPNHPDVQAEGLSSASSPHSPEIEGAELAHEPE